MDFETQLWKEHIYLYWIFSYVLCLYNFKCIIPSFKIVSVVLFNQIIVYPFVKMAPTMYNTDYVELTDILLIPLYLYLYYIIHCIWFYFIHRLMHTRLLWNTVHKIHHQIIDTNPYTALYCHFIEHLVLNLMSVFIGPIIFPSTQIALKIWFHMTTLSTINAHNSISRIKKQTHDIHHMFYKYNFGTGVVLDKLFNAYYSISH